jgi:hypothetical protein
MTSIATETKVEGSGLVQWRYLAYAAAAIAVMIGAVLWRDLWFLNFIHVISGLLWTGVDLFLGFIIGPTMRQLDLPARRALAMRLTPRTLFLLPTLAIITTTAGWYLAQELGYLDLPWPQFWWVVAALIIVSLLSLQGFGFLLPTNLRVLFELQKPEPDNQKIARLMHRYVRAVAFQGVLQVLIIVVMSEQHAPLHHGVRRLLDLDALHGERGAGGVDVVDLQRHVAVAVADIVGFLLIPHAHELDRRVSLKIAVPDERRGELPLRGIEGHGAIDIEHPQHGMHEAELSGHRRALSSGFR